MSLKMQVSYSQLIKIIFKSVAIFSANLKNVQDNLCTLEKMQPASGVRFLLYFNVYQLWNPYPKHDSILKRGAKTYTMPSNMHVEVMFIKLNKVI